MPRHVALTALVTIFLAAAPAQSQRFYDASNLLPPPDGDIALGGSVVDVNGDGLVDLYRKNRFLLQENDGTFTDVFNPFGYTTRLGGSFGAIFADANNDGYLETFFMDLDENLPYYLGHSGLYAEEHSNDSGIHNVEIVSRESLLCNNGLLNATDRSQRETRRAIRQDFVPYQRVADSLLLRLQVELTTVDLSDAKRVAFYPLGAAEAFLLDALQPNWKAHYFEDMFHLERYYHSDSVR